MINKNTAEIFALIIGLSLSMSYLSYPAYGLGDGTDIHIISSELSPVHVEPGSDMSLSVTVHNLGGGLAKNLSLEIIPDPVIINMNENKRILRNDLCGHCSWTETYYFHIDPSAVSGVYRIDIKAHQDGVGESKTIDVLVQGVPQLMVSNVSINPDVIGTGEKFAINYSVINRGTGVANAIRITSVTDSLPFVPEGTNTLFIGTLSPGAARELTYNMYVKENSKPDSYSIPVRLDYKSEDGRNFSISELIGVTVTGKSRVSVAGVNTDPNRIEKGDYVTLTIRIENSGDTDVKSAAASIDIPFAGTKTAFLGKIEPDEDVPAIFNLQADEAGNYRYRIAIRYEDTSGIHEYRQELDMIVDEKPDYGLTIILALLVVSAAAYVVYTRLLKGK